MESIVPILVIGALVWVVFTLARPSYDFEIIIAAGAVNMKGSIPLGKHQAIANFFRDDLPGVKNGRVGGKWQGNRLKLDCRGDLNGHQQRVRNFLIDTL